MNGLFIALRKDEGSICLVLAYLCTFKMFVVLFYKASVYAIDTPVSVNSMQCIIPELHPPTQYKILLRLNE